jgi:hypothetical protein
MDSREESEAALASALKTRKSMGITSEHQANYLVAKNVADEEMGRYGEYPLEYSLQQKTKNTLLAHGRQDVAHALCNTKSIMDQNARIAAQLRLLNFLVLVTVCLLGAIVVKLYPELLSGLH